MKQSANEQLKAPTSAINSVRRVATNTVSILASDVTTRAATFVLYTLIARYLGAYEFGQMSLGLTFFQTFQLLAIGGMQTLVTREVAKDRTRTEKYLVNASVVVTAFSLASVLFLVVLVRLMKYSQDTTEIILLLAIGLLPYALSVICDAIFQAWERMHFITYANALVNGFKIALGFLLLSQGYDLHFIIWLLFFSHLASLLVKWWLLLKHITRPRIKLDFHFCLEIARSTVTFLGIDGLIAVMSSLNIILLSKLATEVEVGLLSAASQLLVPMSLVFQSVVISAFPVMCRSFDPSYQRLKLITERLLELLLAIVIPTAVGLFFVAEAALLFLYGDQDFSLAAGALRILIGVLVLRTFTQVLGRVLVASLREKVTFRILAVDLVANVILAPILISQYGLMGAAMTALIVRVIDAIQHYLPVSRSFPGGIALFRLTWKPAVASLCMATYLNAIRGQNLWLTIISAGVLYAAIFSVLTIWSVGGPRQLKARYLYLWPRSH